MRATIFPTLPYRDAAAAVAWLCRAFGFEPRRVQRDSAGTVIFAQLVLGDGMVILGPAPAEGSGAVQLPPLGHVTQSAYVMVTDADAHHARAKRAGAEIVAPPADEPMGGRSYSCRDLEGHLWHFGTYDPWAQA
ncbi:VOC family protein [Paracraurococcus ruber]|uniref:Glyoxalase n=1 Tax=Paracraurococcus ruber TaxID=77675 RepID=A0ABS1CXH7_9PROT|nr:VOC family protein [Paracraurococcus ruber]MBK1658732.1 glyoxalase [Paracraurococcus ruber]TDG30329.1 glyoxalase [Paracraurococcus ruber]